MYMFIFINIYYASHGLQAVVPAESIKQFTWSQNIFKEMTFHLAMVHKTLAKEFF